MSEMFFDAASFNAGISLWNTSSVEDMSGLFSGAASFNVDISLWNTSRATSMSEMFMFSNDVNSEFNGDLSLWNTSRVTSMSAMFSGASKFNGDLSLWDTSRVIDMKGLFQGASVFNGSLSSWKTSRVTTMNSMFDGASIFDDNLSSWDTASVQDMFGLFHLALSFNGVLSSWNTSSVTDMKQMFSFASDFNGEIRSWDTSRVTDMSEMFFNAKRFNEVLCWNSLRVLSQTDMFNGSSARLLPYPECSFTRSPSKKPTLRPTSLPTVMPTFSVWSKAWNTRVSPLYGKFTSNLTGVNGTCPEGSKIVSISGSATDRIYQLSATCDDKRYTRLGPWGKQIENIDLKNVYCPEGFKGWNITHGLYIGRMGFACADQGLVVTIGNGEGNTANVSLLKNQSIIGFQVYYDSGTGIHAMSIEYVVFPATGPCYDSMGELTGNCPTTADYLAIVWGFLTIMGVAAIVGLIIRYKMKKRHEKDFLSNDAILPLK